MEERDVKKSQSSNNINVKNENNNITNKSNPGDDEHVSLNDMKSNYSSFEKHDHLESVYDNYMSKSARSMTIVTDDQKRRRSSTNLMRINSKKIDTSSKGFDSSKVGMKYILYFRIVPIISTLAIIFSCYHLYFGNRNVLQQVRQNIHKTTCSDFISITFDGNDMNNTHIHYFTSKFTRCDQLPLSSMSILRNKRGKEDGSLEAALPLDKYVYYDSSFNPINDWTDLIRMIDVNDRRYHTVVMPLRSFKNRGNVYDIDFYSFNTMKHNLLNGNDEFNGSHLVFKATEPISSNKYLQFSMTISNACARFGKCHNVFLDSSASLPSYCSTNNNCFDSVLLNTIKNTSYFLRDPDTSTDDDRSQYSHDDNIRKNLVKSVNKQCLSRYMKASAFDNYYRLSDKVLSSSSNILQKKEQFTSIVILDYIRNACLLADNSQIDSYYETSVSILLTSQKR